MELEIKNITDPRALRGVAHPVRGKLLEEIAARGQTRATDLSRALSLPVNTVSYHLRQLAKYGYLTECKDGRHDNRDRVWTLAARDGFSYDELKRKGPEASKILDDTLRKGAEARSKEIFDFYNPERAEGFYATRDIPVRLNKNEVAELTDLLYKTARDFNDFHQTIRQDTTTIPKDVDETVTYLVRIYIQPSSTSIP